jgi:CDP-4-dehydro-6-deoxyglucose reductase
MLTITLANHKSFAADVAVSLLDAAQSAGLTLEHSCRTGRCGVCKTQVTQGATTVLRPEESLSAAELAAGWVLTCCRAAATDVQLNTCDLDALPALPVQTLPCRIDRLERLAPDVLQVLLRLPPAQSLNHRPGQYLNLIGPGGVQRSYSLANAPRADGKLELHIRQVPEGVFSRYWFGAADAGGAKVGDLLRLRGPLGSFGLRQSKRAHWVLLATGTGMAPILALLEQLLAACDAGTDWSAHHIHVYWGGRNAQDLYAMPRLTALMHSLSARLSAGCTAECSPVLSRPAADWTGRTGHVQAAVLQDARHGALSLADATVYACGSLAMIGDARAQLVQAGLDARQFYADAFVGSN